MTNIVDFDFIKKYEKKLPNSIKKLINYKENFSIETELVQFYECIQNLLLNSISHTNFIQNEAVIEESDIIYKSYEYENDSVNYSYISTSNVGVYPEYNKTLNTLFALMQICENDDNSYNLLFSGTASDENIFGTFLSEYQNDMTEVLDEDKLIVRHVMYHMYKLFFTLLNMHIFNSIAFYNSEFNYRLEANYCLSKCITDIRTQFSLNTNILNVKVIKDTLNKNIIFLKTDTEDDNDISHNYRNIENNKYILRDANDPQKIYTITNNFNIKANIEFMVKVDRDLNYNKDTELIIESKTTGHYKNDFNNNKKTIKKLNSTVNKQYDEYEKNINFITYFESLYSEIDIITILFYIIFAIILFVVLFVDLSLNMRIFTSLIGIGGVVIFYVITIAMYNFKENFYSDMPITVRTQTYNMTRENAYENVRTMLDLINITSDIVEMQSMHRDSMRAMDLDALKLEKENVLFDNNINTASNILNDKKHNLLLYTLRITLLTYLSIILLIFNILYSIHPEYNILIITLTSVAIIYIIFYYIYNINKSVRSNYVNKYYPEVYDMNNF